MREETFSTPGQPALRVTFSGGVARYGEDGGDLRSLYRAADEVLYRARRSAGVPPAGLDARTGRVRGWGRSRHRQRCRILPVGWQQNTVDTVDVVVVENDETLSEFLSEALATRGLRCLKVSDGPGAIALLCPADGPLPRVVLLDADLPGMSGVDVLGELQRAGVLGYSKAIMLSAQAGETEVLAAFARGAFDHVTKPFSIPVLMQRIRRAQAAA